MENEFDDEPFYYQPDIIRFREIARTLFGEYESDSDKRHTQSLIRDIIDQALFAGEISCYDDFGLLKGGDSSIVVVDINSFLFWLAKNPEKKNQIVFHLATLGREFPAGWAKLIESIDLTQTKEKEGTRRRGRPITVEWANTFKKIDLKMLKRKYKTLQAIQASPEFWKALGLKADTYPGGSATEKEWAQESAVTAKYAQTKISEALKDINLK